MKSFDITTYLMNTSHVLLLILYVSFLRNSWADIVTYIDADERYLTPNVRKLYRLFAVLSTLSSLVFFWWWGYDLYRQLSDGFDLNTAMVIHSTMEALSFVGLAMAGIALFHFLPSAAVLYLDLLVILLSSTLFALFNNHIDAYALNLDFAVLGTAMAMLIIIAGIHYGALLWHYIKSERGPSRP